MRPSWVIRTSHRRRCGHLILVGLTASVLLFHLFAATGRYRSGDTYQKSRIRVKVDKKYPGRDHKAYKFYDYGSVYHDMNFTCPVAWVRVDVESHYPIFILIDTSISFILKEWTDNPLEADALWYNVLNNGAAAGQSMSSMAESAEQPSNPLKVFMSLESEAYYPYIVGIKESGKIDVTVDYRIWSDAASASGTADVPAVYLQNPTNEATKIDFRAPPVLPKRKDVYLAVFISNCESRSGRERYLTELMENMPVHSYGGCHHNKDEPAFDGSVSKWDRKRMIGQQYHFVFAAENSEAPSYVTEKVYDSFAAGAVPVYFGAPNIDKFIPDPSAIIAAKDYSPKDLAVLLNRTARDPKEYAKYFEWKKRPYSKEFRRILCLASRTVQCRLAMHMEGLDMEQDCDEAIIDTL